MKMDANMAPIWLLFLTLSQAVGRPQIARLACAALQVATRCSRAPEAKVQHPKQRASFTRFRLAWPPRGIQTTWPLDAWHWLVSFNQANGRGIFGIDTFREGGQNGRIFGLHESLLTTMIKSGQVFEVRPTGHQAVAGLGPFETVTSAESGWKRFFRMLLGICSGKFKVRTAKMGGKLNWPVLNSAKA